MALIPQEKPKQIALIVAVVALGLGYAFYAYWYTPRSVAVAELQTRLGELQNQNRTAQVIAARGGAALEETLATYERHVERLEQLIPAGEEVPALLNSLALEARRSRTELVGLTPGPEEPGEFYTRRTYELIVVGEFHDVARFLTAVGSLPRIVTSVNLEVEPVVEPAAFSSMESPVQARFDIETYVLPAGNGGGAGTPGAEGASQG